MLGNVVAMAPQCFTQANCAQLCVPMDSMITQYMTDMDVSAIKKLVCEQKPAFSCLFNSEEHIKACVPLMETAKSFGLGLPSDLQGLHHQCAVLLGGGHDDMQSNETEDEGNSSTTQMLTSSAAAVAAAPVVLLASVAACFL